MNVRQSVDPKAFGLTIALFTVLALGLFAVQRFWALQSYSGRVVTVSITLILLFTFVEYIQTRKAYPSYHGSSFSRNRWIAFSALIFILVAIVESLPTAAARMDATMVMGVIIMLASAFFRSSAGPIPQLLVATFMALMAAALILKPSVATSAYFFYLPFVLLLCLIAYLASTKPKA